TFNGRLLVFHRLWRGEDPLVVPLVFVDFWVQIHDLPSGLILEAMARRVAIWKSCWLGEEGEVFRMDNVRRSSQSGTMICVSEGTENVNPNLNLVEEDSSMEVREGKKL
ncbi:hypothetical protein Gohar_027980, partial [Gossypium harknessii]|nr:hypothetical protein [Gossypium harknessii]